MHCKLWSRQAWFRASSTKKVKAVMLRAGKGKLARINVNWKLRTIKKQKQKGMRKKSLVRVLRVMSNISGRVAQKESD